MYDGTPSITTVRCKLHTLYELGPMSTRFQYLCYLAVPKQSDNGVTELGCEVKREIPLLPHRNRFVGIDESIFDDDTCFTYTTNWIGREQVSARGSIPVDIFTVRIDWPTAKSAEVFLGWSDPKDSSWKYGIIVTRSSVQEVGSV